MADCATEIITKNAVQLSRNSTLVVYRCKQDFYLASGDLIRMCSNGTWTGKEPTCLVDSVLPKQLLVLLIVGVTVTLFAFCIPFDFYRFRKRKQACREKQERINMMVRIQPFHAKYMGTQESLEEEPAPSRSFGLGSILAFFRFVRNRRTRRAEVPAEAAKETPPEQPAVNVTSQAIPLEKGTTATSDDPSLSIPLPKLNSTPAPLPSPIHRARSINSDIGKTDAKVVTPRSATFTHSKCLPDLKTGYERVLPKDTSIETELSKKRECFSEMKVSTVDEFMDTRAKDHVPRRKPNSSSIAKTSKPFQLNITRYNVASRDTGGASASPLPSVGSSPSRSPICPVENDMGF